MSHAFCLCSMFIYKARVGITSFKPFRNINLSVTSCIWPLAARLNDSSPQESHKHPRPFYSFLPSPFYWRHFVWAAPKSQHNKLAAVESAGHGTFLCATVWGLGKYWVLLVYSTAQCPHPYPAVGQQQSTSIKQGKVTDTTTRPVWGGGEWGQDCIMGQTAADNKA